MTGILAAVSMIRARRRARAEAAAYAASQGSAVVDPNALPPKFEGILNKSDGRGRNLKMRWVVADAKRQEIVWYTSDPSAPGGPAEPQGRLGIAGASITAGVSPALRSAETAGLPSGNALTIAVSGRVLVLTSNSEDTVEEWDRYLGACALAEIPVPGGVDPVIAGSYADMDDNGELSVPPAPGLLVPIEGWLALNTPDGKGKDRKWVVMDTDSRLLMVFDDNGKGSGTGESESQLPLLPPVCAAPRPH